MGVTIVAGERQGALLAILVLAHVIGTANIMSVLAMAPLVEAGLAGSHTAFGFLVSAYHTALVVCALPFGRIVDRIGVRRALGLSHLLLAAGAVCFGLAEGLPPALSGALLMGVGYAFVNPATAKGVFDWLPAAKRATAMAVKQSGVPIGGAAAAALGAAAGLLGWQGAFWLVAAADTLGACLFLRLPGARGRAAVDAARLSIGGLAAVVRNRNLAALGAGVAVYNLGQATFFAYLALFLRDFLQASAPVASLCFGAVHAVSAVGRIGWGLVSDQLCGGRRKPGLVGIGTATVLLLGGLAALSPGQPALLGLGAILLLGLTINGFPGLSQTAVLEAVGPGQVGSAIGYASLLSAAGAIVGPPLFGLAVDLTGRFSSGWLACAVLVLLGTLVLLGGYHEQDLPARRPAAAGRAQGGSGPGPARRPGRAPTSPKIQAPSHSVDGPAAGTVGGEPMPREQRESLERRSREAGVEFQDHLTEDEASKRIEALEEETGRTGRPVHRSEQGER